MAFETPTLEQRDAWEEYGRCMLRSGMTAINDHWWARFKDRAFHKGAHQKAEQELEQRMHKLFQKALGET